MENLINILSEIENKKIDLRETKIKIKTCKSRYAKKDLYRHVKKLERELGKLYEQKRNFTL